MKKKLGAFCATVLLGALLGVSLLMAGAVKAESTPPPAVVPPSGSSKATAKSSTSKPSTSKSSKSPQKTAPPKAASKLTPTKQVPTKKASPTKQVPIKKSSPTKLKKTVKKRRATMPKGTFAIFSTTHGTFRAELYPQYAPRTVENFIQLAEGKKVYKAGHKTKKITYPFYNGLTFHRVVSRFMIQGGCPKGTGRGGPGYNFADEFSPYLKHDKSGLLSMANSGPNTNGSQFFVTVAPAPWLDNKHSIFGRVVEGYSVVEKISEVRVDKNSKPESPVKINTLRIVRSK